MPRLSPAVLSQFSSALCNMYVVAVLLCKQFSLEMYVVIPVLVVGRREIKRVRVDTVDAAHFSDVSGENHGDDDIVADGDFRPQMQRTPSPTPNDTMENQVFIFF